LLDRREVKHPEEFFGPLRLVDFLFGPPERFPLVQP